MTITLEPLVQYNLSNAPIITVNLLGGSFRRVDTTVCPNYILLTSTKFSFQYYSVIMNPII